MKKSAWVLAAFSAVLFSSPVLAMDDDSQPDILHSTMIGTPDGGALVLYGHTLTKYDSDLEVSKVVDVRKSAKPRAALPSGEDMMIRPHSTRSTETYEPSQEPAPGAFRIPTLSEDEPKSEDSQIPEPSSEL